MISYENKKILTIDDEDELRRSFQLFFEDEGFIVFEACNGREGLEVFRKENPDIVLVDLRMPEMDGLEVIEILAKEAPDVPVIVVSGTGMLEDAIEAIRAGASDYITKPVTDLLVMEHTVKKALEKAHLIAQNRMYQENLEELVEKRTAELRQAQKMEAIGTLAGGIAHDFNNILSAIFGFTQLAQMREKNNPKLCQDLEQVHNAAIRAKDLVQQILTFSRQGEQERHAIQIHLIVKEAIKLLRASIPSTIDIRGRIPGDCGLVMADTTQLHQVVMNLCTNAYHAMRENGGLLEVTLAPFEIKADTYYDQLSLEPGEYIRLTVRDTGHGIKESLHGTIFEPYFTTKKKGEGTGLGLAVVHGIVTSHKGQITVDSKPGQGATFHVYFPRCDSETDSLPHETSEQILPRGTEHILAVDDEKAITMVLEEMLTGLGYRVTAVNGSVEALEKFKAEPENFDLVITDMTMPDMTGAELTRELLAIRQELPIILTTGFTEKTTREAAMALGIRKFLPKPIAIEELAPVIREALEEGK